jgi:hypothetical protein
MMNSEAMVAPVIALVAWSMIMWFWMYATRIPAIRSAKIKLDPHMPRGTQMASLPSKVRWKGDNYNHLMEQPTIFYALALSLAMLGEGNDFNLFFAWIYVVLRVVHSLFQALVNKIEIRFLLFALSNIPLLVLTVSGIYSLSD